MSKNLTPHHFISKQEAVALNRPSLINSTLLSGLLWLDKLTGVKWRMTSFIRNSYNHSGAVSLDVAPFAKYPGDYALPNGLDPLLPNRIAFIRALIKGLPAAPLGIAFFVETDHIHMQVLKDQNHYPLVVRWPGPKGHCYHNADHDDINGRSSAPYLKSRSIADNTYLPFVGYDEHNRAYQREYLAQALLRSAT